MHMSGPSRGGFLGDQRPAALYPPRRAGRMTVIAIAGVGPQGVVHRSSRFARAPAVRVDSTAARLIGFPGDQLVQTQSGSILFNGMWMVLLSWHAAKLGPR